MKRKFTTMVSICLVLCTLLCLCGCRNPKTETETESVPIATLEDPKTQTKPEATDVSATEATTEENIQTNTFETVVDFGDDFEVIVGVGEPDNTPSEADGSTETGFGSWG